MSLIEAGKVKPGYLNAVEPYRNSLKNLPEEAFQFLLTHDSRHFLVPMREAIPKGPLDDYFKSNFFSGVLPNLEAMAPDIAEAVDRFELPESSHPRVEAATRRVKSIVPFIPAYLSILARSVMYLDALRTSNFQDEERHLASLAEKTLPMAPICRYMNSDFKSDSDVTDEKVPAINGLEVLVLQNLLVNSYRHGFPLSKEPGAPTAETTYDTESGKIEIWNYSEIQIFRAKVLARAFYEGRGLLIADLNATITERPFDINCIAVPISDLEKATYGSANKYKVTASF